MQPIRSHRRRLLLAAALLLAVTLPAAALPPERDQWIELRTPSFTLFSDASEKSARRAAAELERLRAVLGQLNPELKLTSPTPTFLFVFRDAEAFRPYRRVYQGRQIDAGGYFLSRPEVSWMAVDGDPRGDAAAVVNHEYLHYLLRHNYPGLPLWFNEGLAELYSSFRADGAQALIGVPIAEHVAWLRRHPPIPLADLFAVDQTSRDYNEGNRRGVFYAESWALVHYLLVGSPEHREQAPRFLQELARGAATAAALQTAFGLDAAALERELRSYVRGQVFAYRTVPVAPLEQEADLRFAQRPVSRAEALARLGTLLVALDPTLWPAATEHFRAALALEPDQPLALAGLGQIEELSGRPRDALPYYEKAASRAPDDFVVQYLYGLDLQALDPTAEGLRRAGAAFARAVALQPDFGDAWARLALTQAQADPPPPEAIRSFATAHRLLPERADLAYNLMLSYARAGRRDEAQRVIETAIAPRGTPADVRRAWEALVKEGRREVEERIGKGDLAGAIPLLEQLIAQSVQSPNPEQRAELTARLADVRQVLDYNRFVERYNRAMELAGRDPQAAIAILEDLVATTREPGQVEQAKKVLASLKAERRR